MSKAVASAVDYVAVHARLNGARVAAVDLTRARQWTYAEFDDWIARMCAALRRRGIKRGDRVAALAKNRPGLVALHHACARLGVMFVPLNWRLAPPELAWLVRDCAPRILLGDPGLLAAASLEGEDIDAFEAALASERPFTRVAVKAHLPSLLLYTSGTSGHPKGAQLTENNLRETAINFSLLGNVDADSVVLCDAPMFHVIGLVTNVRPVFLRGGTILVSDGFEPSRSLARLADPQLKITHYFCVPQMAAQLRRVATYNPNALSGLKAIFTGGAPHPAANIRAFLADGVTVVDGYGLSEAGTVFGMPIDRALIDRHAGSVGVAAPTVETKIVDANGKVCPANVAGELLLRGANIAKGYWGRPDATADAFAEGGWFRTGDIVLANEEGFHWIVDRKKDMFISGGENVYPVEIEAALAARADIRECAVIGAPDPQWGEVGVLFIAANEGAAIEADAVRADLSKLLARFKVPKHVLMVDALPRNGAGKVLKSTLRDWARARL